MLKRFVGDTYMDAFLQAKMELGEDILVVQSKPFNQKKWYGMYSQEMVEILVALPRDPAATTPARPNAPARPVPTEDVSAIPGYAVPSRTRPGTTSQAAPTPRPAAPPPPTPTRSTPVPPPSAKLPASGPATYSSQPAPARQAAMPLPRTPRPLHSSLGGEPQQGRFINTLRSNQIGDQEPQSQRLEDDARESEKILQQALSAILRQKTLLQSEQAVQAPPLIPMPNPRGQALAAVLAPTPIQPEPGKSGELPLQVFDERLNQMLSLMQELQAKTSRLLETPSASCPEGLLKIRERLQVVETPPDTMELILEELRARVPSPHLRNPSLMMVEARKWLKEKIRFGEELDPPRGRGPQFIALIGPTGVGKTTTIAKLAAQFALDRATPRRVALFTLDTFRIGAPAQLSQYAQIIEAEMEILMETNEIPAALERHRNKDLILVDTAGRCPKNSHELEEMKKFLSCFPKIRKFLTLSATTRYSDMLVNTRNFGEVGFDNMIITKVDETSSIGPLLGLMMSTSAPLSYLTYGQSVPDDFRRADHEFFLDSLFPNP